MKKPLKEGVTLNCKLDKKTDQLLTEFCQATGMSKTATVERALRAYIESYNKTGKV